jgi:hypothetical protein
VPVPRPRNRYFCELDRWTFDARYTDGKCPICGWAPEGAPAAPGWLVTARRFEWELTGLVALMVVLVVLGAVVAHAAGYRIPLLSSSAPAAPAQVASPARTSATPSANHSPSPSAKASPSPSR